MFFKMNARTALMKRVGYFTAHELDLETTGQSGGVEFAFEFNLGA